MIQLLLLFAAPAQAQDTGCSNTEYTQDLNCNTVDVTDENAVNLIDEECANELFDTAEAEAYGEVAGAGD